MLIMKFSSLQIYITEENLRFYKLVQEKFVSHTNLSLFVGKIIIERALFAAALSKDFVKLRLQLRIQDMIKSTEKYVHKLTSYQNNILMK